ncbi:nitroreductase family protein [Chlorobaculum sp. MV4-Y]|uniref:nitroreductase family protein n=1 Tax=Chlorobaculum sp. MV4-Y TaxID=2976335 RepID=UPI0021AF15D1|nr:nitroreductase family protein [Chlorobaculum sp. MV4-Y]UWX57746.1 nitroreductase family protein [Chlorobaculum sp. MV4-Y]
MPPEILERVLETGRLAPSAKNLQPWKFLLVSLPEMLAKIRPCYERDWFRRRHSGWSRSRL